MSVLTLRTVKGSELTSAEIDANFTTLDIAKAPTASPTLTGVVTLPSQSVALTGTVLPSIRPSLNLDFANSKQLDPRITFNRGTTATYYDGKTTAKAEENLLKGSNDFGTAATWVSINGTVGTGVTAPDGTISAYSFTATGVATLYQTLTASALPYTLTLYIQRVTGTGAVNLTLDGTTLTAQTITASWARYTLTVTPTAASHTIGLQLAVSGDVVNIWGAQLEQRSQATTYTPTTTAPITNYIPQLMTAPAGVARFDHDVRPTLNGTCTVSGSTVTLPTSFADGSAPSTSNGYYTGLITISGVAYTITGYVGSTRIVTVTGTPTAGAFSLVNPANGQSLGLLIEEGRTNILLQSNTLTGPGVAAGATIETSALISPDGTLNASIFSGTGGAIATTVTKSALATNTSMTISFYVKANLVTTRTTLQFLLRNNTTGAEFSGGVFNTITGVLTGAGWLSTYVGDDWYRVSFSQSSGITAGDSLSTYIGATGGNVYPTTDIWSIWGIQLEAGAFATSYIPTTTGAVTRVADNASMTVTNFSSWYNQSQGSFYLDVGSAKGEYPQLFELFSSSNAYLKVGKEFANSLPTTTIAYRAIDYGIDIYYINTTATQGKLAFNVTLLDTKISGNGVAPVTTTITQGKQLGIFNTLSIGYSIANGGRYCNTYIKKLSYYPKALNSTELQGLTQP
jgi:hypothetical protein